MEITLNIVERKVTKQRQQQQQKTVCRRNQLRLFVSHNQHNILVCNLIKPFRCFFLFLFSESWHIFEYFIGNIVNRNSKTIDCMQNIFWKNEKRFLLTTSININWKMTNWMMVRKRKKKPSQENALNSGTNQTKWAIIENTFKYRS